MNNTIKIGFFAALAGIASLEAGLTISSSNLLGFDATTSAMVDNAGNAILNGQGVVAVGSFGAMTDGDIQALSSAGEFAANFAIAGSTAMNSGFDGLWSNPVNNTDDPSGFAGLPIFTLVGNGDSIGESTQFFVYRHSDLNAGTGTFNEAPGTNEGAIVAAGGGATGSVVVGDHGVWTHDFGAGAVDAFNLVTVPEPSSTALLGLGGVALLLRRRR